MFRGFKTEIDPTPQQIDLIKRTIGTCRFIYNFYISYNKERHENGEKFIAAKAFSVWFNNEFLPRNPDHNWIKDVSSKSVKQSIENAHKAYKRFFSGTSGFPKYKKKNVSEPNMYFVKNNKTDCLCERHRIKIPTLGWVKLKEKGYIPTTESGYIITSGSVSMHAGRYYVSVLVRIPDWEPETPTGDGLGIDLGLKEFAVVSDGWVFGNINKKSKVKRLEKQLRREQRCLSRKLEAKNNKKGEATCKNIDKQKLKVQKLHQRLANIRTDYVNKVVFEVVKTKPSFITIEDLNVSGMMKNRHLSKAIANQKFYEFRGKLERKCAMNGIELRVVDRWYPSSKMCNHCGAIRKNLKLSDREYRCQCGYVEDRDINASLNLRDAKTYEVA